MMSAKQDFLKAIWDQPHDDLPRLVYADWLEEQGDAARAEFIRLQCEYAKTEKYEDHWYDLGIRIEKLWKKHKKTWQAELHPTMLREPFERGFVSPRPHNISASKFLALGSEELDAAPLRRFHFTTSIKSIIKASQHPNMRLVDFMGFRTFMCRDSEQPIFESGNYANLSSLAFTTDKTDDTTSHLLSNIARFPMLKNLFISFSNITEASISELTASPLMSRLTAINLSLNELTNIAVEMLANSDNAANLRSLTYSKVLIDSSEIDGYDETIRIIFNSTKMKNLKEFYSNRLSDQHAIDELLESEPCFHLRRMTLSLDRLAYDRISALMNWKGLESVRVLSVWFPGLNAEIASRISRSPYLNDLRQIESGQIAAGAKPEIISILRNRWPNINVTSIS